MTLRVLIAGPSESMSHSIIEECSNLGFAPQYYHEEDLDQISKALQKTCWNLILYHTATKGIHSQNVLQTVRKFDSVIPFIIILDSFQEELAMDFIKAGADDCLYSKHLSNLGNTVITAQAQAYNRHVSQSSNQNKNDNQHLTSLYQTMEQGVIYQDLCGRIIHCNPAAEKILGRSIHEMKALAFPDECCQAFRDDGSLYTEQMRPSVLAIQKDETVRDLIGVFNHQENRHRWISVSTFVKRSSQKGTAIGVFSTFEDVTRLYNAEAQLKEAYQIAGLGHWELNLQTNHLTWSQSIYELFEVQPESFPATFESFLHFVHPEDRDTLANTYRNSVEQKSPYSLTHRLLMPDGRIKWVKENGCTTYDNQGQPIRSVGTVHNITDIKQLEHRVSQAQRMEAIGRLAGGVAHDFNNLLTLINNYAYFIDADLQDDNPMKEDVQQILEAGQRAADLTRQLLAFSRKQILEPKILCINDIIFDLQKMLGRLIGEDIDICTVLPDDIGLIQADPSQIEQILMNLAINSRDAMPQGGRLTIETATVNLDEDYTIHHPGATPGPHVMLAVSDNGVGMSEQVRQRIFEPFFTTKGKGHSTGLGLATVYGIVKQSGGNIWVYSELGKGTTFKIYLPQTNTKESEDINQTETTRLFGDETILVVEDEEGVRLLTKRILAEAGYQVLVARNASEAIQMCEGNKSKPDMLLTDVVMPEVSGKILAENLSATIPQLKILFMSGYTDNAIVHHGVLDPGTHFIAKPFNTVSLLQKVREVLDISQ